MQMQARTNNKHWSFPCKATAMSGLCVTCMHTHLDLVSVGSQSQGDVVVATSVSGLPSSDWPSGCLDLQPAVTSLAVAIAAAVATAAAAAAVAAAGLACPGAV